MSNKVGTIAMILAVIALILSVFALVRAGSPGEQATADIQYVLYLGTNDKDTNEPVCTADEAKDLADEVLTRHFDGFTIQEAMGGWTNEDGTVSHEYTLVIYLSDTDIDTIRAACDDLIRAFNQSAVLIQTNETITEFYSGETAS